jgi:broad specificity phosphatase PhoE
VFGGRGGQAAQLRARPEADRRRGGPGLKLYLVRHAKAGSRGDWDGADELRPLSKAGRRQAKGLAKQLRDEPIFRVVSSPYVRCVQTVAPQAESRELPVEKADALAERTPLSEVLRLIEKVADKPTVLCTHGDIADDLLSHLRDRRVPLEGGLAFPKGSTWVLDVEDGDIVHGRYLPPPA